MNIHPTAIVDKKAELSGDVEVGPYSIVGPNVKIDSGTKIFNNVTIVGNTTIGKNNTFFPFCSIGSQPQDLKFKGEDTRLEIGNNNVFRESVTVNPGTAFGGGLTKIGNNNFVMAYCHIAHDCILEDNIVMANGVQIGGHVKIENDVTFGGLAAVHHFVTIGKYSFIGGLTRIVKDVPPFMITEGNPARTRSVNFVGLKRKNFSDESIRILKESFKILFLKNLTQNEALKIISEKFESSPEVRYLLQFIRNMQNGKNGRARQALRPSIKI